MLSTFSICFSFIKVFNSSLQDFVEEMQMVKVSQSEIKYLSSNNMKNNFALKAFHE